MVLLTNNLLFHRSQRENSVVGCGWCRNMIQTGKYQIIDRVKEGHASVMYGCTVNDIDPGNANLVATIGSNQASIYRLNEGKFEYLQGYKDEDSDEEFYCCKFSYVQTSPEIKVPILILGGKQGLIKILDLTTCRIFRVLMGHGDSIHEFAVNRQRPHLLFSASKDCTIRVWNMKSGCCVVSVSGRGKHMLDVLSVDVSPINPDWFVTCLSTVLSNPLTIDIEEFRESSNL
eukprot:TRINITY_DN35938_c0_g2_i2.p2 TRINITY_DN35938_c0_g2~~TRINITY_DN35938_c0_g2_i2.p2  ORF type:complete len:231 (+),score=4.49 TRINITY_DN35938_c0_g2_i2:42-734(+)